MVSTLADLASSLYKEKPERRLHHYTSTDAFLGIFRDGGLRATAVQYFSDSSELSHALRIMRRHIDTLHGNNRGDKKILSQLANWLVEQMGERTSIYHVPAALPLFAACFSEEGDLLSQWRGYTPHGKGLSLEFTPERVTASAGRQGYELVRCIYDSKLQNEIIDRATACFIADASEIGEDGKYGEAQSYRGAFESLKTDLFRIIVVLKNQAFEAEKEWRAVLRIDDSATSRIEYRAGRTTLMPYVLFDLKDEVGNKLMLHNVLVGPTPHSALAIAALKRMLAGNLIATRYPVMLSAVPYREM